MVNSSIADFISSPYFLKLLTTTDQKNIYSVGLDYVYQIRIKIQKSANAQLYLHEKYYTISKKFVSTTI